MAGAWLRHEIRDKSIILISFRVFLEYDMSAWRGLQCFLGTLGQRSRVSGCNQGRVALSLYTVLLSSGDRRLEVQYLLRILRPHRVLCVLEFSSGAANICSDRWLGAFYLERLCRLQTVKGEEYETPFSGQTNWHLQKTNEMK